MTASRTLLHSREDRRVASERSSDFRPLSRQSSLLGSTLKPVLAYRVKMVPSLPVICAIGFAVFTSPSGPDKRHRR
jgi:hypothetical protein